MIFADGVLGLVFLGLWIFCIIDAITTPPEQCRNLPKIAWIFIVILLVDIGSIVWLVAGRDWSGRTRDPRLAGSTHPSARGSRAEPTNPDDDEEFQRLLRQRVEQQRKRASDGQPDEPPAGT